MIFNIISSRYCTTAKILLTRNCVNAFCKNAKSSALGHSITSYNCIVFCLVVDFTEIIFFVFFVQQWKLHLFELEEEMKINPPIKYVLYQVVIFCVLIHLSSMWE